MRKSEKSKAFGCEAPPRRRARPSGVEVEPLRLELRDQLAGTQRNFLETDLSLAATFADTAKRRYEAGYSDRADWSKHQAEIALRTVRHFVATTDLLSAVVLDSLAQRCDELERILMSLDRAK